MKKSILSKKLISLGMSGVVSFSAIQSAIAMESENVNQTSQQSQHKIKLTIRDLDNIKQLLNLVNRKANNILIEKCIAHLTEISNDLNKNSNLSCYISSSDKNIVNQLDMLRSRISYLLSKEKSLTKNSMNYVEEGRKTTVTKGKSLLESLAEYVEGKEKNLCEPMLSWNLQTKMR